MSHFLFLQNEREESFLFGSILSPFAHTAYFFIEGGSRFFTECGEKRGVFLFVFYVFGAEQKGKRSIFSFFYAKFGTNYLVNALILRGKDLVHDGKAVIKQIFAKIWYVSHRLEDETDVSVFNKIRFFQYIADERTAHPCDNNVRLPTSACTAKSVCFAYRYLIRKPAFRNVSSCAFAWTFVNIGGKAGASNAVLNEVYRKICVVRANVYDI